MKSIYLPSQFEVVDAALALTLMREHPLAELISVDDDGAPYVTPLPLHAQQTESGLVLLGHCARSNPHWRYLQARSTALVTFMGPHAYMSPRVYPDLKRVPTWSYLALHCTVQAQLIDDPQGKDGLLKQLIEDHDPAYANQWRALDDDYQQGMMRGIVAFELQVISLRSKFKLNQHRPESHAAMHATYAEGSASERALAVWMERLGMVNPRPAEDA